MTAPKAPVERKVTAGSLLSLAAGVTFAVLNAVIGNAAMLDPLPDWAQFLILAAAPPILTFLGGYAAPHTPRSGAR